VRPGYKQTEVGLIPAGWDLTTMDSLTSLMTNGFVGTATSAYVPGDDGVLYIQGYNVQENGFNFHGIKRVSRTFHARNQKSCLRPGDLLTIQTGDIGVTTVVPPALAGANCHALVISRMDSRVSEPNYYCQYFNSERGRAQLKEIETGSTMKHLNVGDMKLLLLPSPPVEEQRAIATALGDMDALLVGLHRLIAKKRDIKQAAMQKLLTGQTRLPGFQGEWDVKTIADLERRRLVKLSRGQVISKKDIDQKPGEFPIYSSSIHNDGLFGCYGNFMFDEELITWSVDGGGNFFHRPKHKFSVTNVCGFMRVDTSEIDYRFMAAELQLLHSSKSFDYQSKAHPSVVRREYEVQIASLPEQRAIATVLSDMDAELTALEARRDKIRALKQGMMQELLTGRTRLV